MGWDYYLQIFRLDGVALKSYEEMSDLFINEGKKYPSLYNNSVMAGIDTGVHGLIVVGFSNYE